MKFCKDCKHIELDVQGVQLEYARCLHPAIVRHNPVTGVVESFCKTERKSYGDKSLDLCGPEGKLFEPFELKI